MRFRKEGRLQPTKDEADGALRAAFLTHIVAMLSAAARGWRASSEIEADRATWLDHELSRCVDLSFGAGFQSACPVPGARSGDYLQRVISLESGGCFLAGIRFRGGELSFPFVELLTTSFGPGRLDEVWARAAEAYAVFAPRCLRVFSDRPLVAPGLREEVDQHVIAGELAALAARPPLRSRLRLHACEPKRAAALVEQAYQALPAELEGLVPPASLSDLEGCAADGALRVAVVDGAEVGVVAAARAAAYGLAGFEMFEEVLLPAYRGRGLAAPMQQSLARVLAGLPRAGALFGTIAGANHASLATAARVGREHVGRFSFLFPPG